MSHLIATIDCVVSFDSADWWNYEKHGKQVQWTQFCSFIQIRQRCLVVSSMKQVSHGWLHVFQRKMRAMSVIRAVDFNIPKLNTLSKGYSDFEKI